MPAVRNKPFDLEWLEAGDWWSRVDQRDDGECWMWKQSVGSHGYGQTFDGITVRLAHRVAWALANGQQIPNDMTVDHICRNRTCVNPAHLRLLTNEDNARDNGQGRKTHCPAGHPYSGDNLYVNRRGHRKCLACQTLANRRRYP